MGSAKVPTLGTRTCAGAGGAGFVASFDFASPLVFGDLQRLGLGRSVVLLRLM